jgi:hypothetical protein
MLDEEEGIKRKDEGGRRKDEGKAFVFTSSFILHPFFIVL